MAQNGSSDSISASETSTSAPKPATKPLPKGNPAFRALGLPNFRLRLPSRNWLIFLSITGSWTAALVYDRRQKKKQQAKWCALVSHLRDEVLPTTSLQRRVTVFLQAPPGDGLRSARDHFLEYVKPVLSAAALDYEVVEGRREGDIRAALAERIRRSRRKNGEHAENEIPLDVKMALDNLRDRTGVTELHDVKGDIIIGRHTWKEYIRGLHEGWLGPLDEPKTLQPESPSSTQDYPDKTAEPALAGDISSSEQATRPDAESLANKDPEDDASPAASTTEDAENKEKKEPDPPPKPLVTPAYNDPSSYSNSHLPRSTPPEFEPSVPISFPHILGFLNTPIRMYRFLNRRLMADDIGRQTAAAVLAVHRPYQEGSSSGSSDLSSGAGDGQWEQQRTLKHEESEWSKSSKKRAPEETRERVWLDDIVIDRRIGERMRRFELDAEDEDRAKRIGNGSQGIPGRHEERSNYGEEGP